MAKEYFPLRRRRSLAEGVRNVIYSASFRNPDSTTGRDEDGTPYNFEGYTFQCQVRTQPGRGGTLLADATVTAYDGNIESTLTAAQSDACFAGAISGVVYADILAAAAGEEPKKLVILTLSTESTVTTWGA